MVAYLHDGGVDDERLASKSVERTKSATLPLSHEAALKWFYKDPQGEIQGKDQDSSRDFLLTKTRTFFFLAA